jgi:hypothetical protein
MEMDSGTSWSQVRLRANILDQESKLVESIDTQFSVPNLEPKN